MAKDHDMKSFRTDPRFTAVIALCDPSRASTV